jgi:hypothetical protein
LLRRHQKGFVLDREFAHRAGARFFAERGFQIATKRRLVRYTVDPPTAMLVAIASSLTLRQINFAERQLTLRLASLYAL